MAIFFSISAKKTFGFINNSNMLFEIDYKLSLGYSIYKLAFKLSCK
ncbi:hypothetical protein BOVA604_3733 [Bacteroides ovatus]|nr:hypothetical protein BOVA604_3733 [Bacteroides ovatus]